MLGMHLLQAEVNITTVSTSVDNQPVISATDECRPRASQHIIQGFLDMADKLVKRVGASLSLEL
jgi:hypothetical protein